MNKKLRLVIALVMVLVIALAFTGCSKKENQNQVKKDQGGNTNQEQSRYPLTVKDDLGNEVVIGKQPKKIVSLAPSNTEILFALGAGEMVVGVTAYCDYPEKAIDIPKVGDVNGVNLEAVLEMDPDVVFNFSGWHKDVVDKLKELNVTVIEIRSESIDETISSIILMGKVIDKENEAEKIAKDIKERKAAVEEKVKGIKDKVTVFYEVWFDPLMTVGKNTFINELIELAGGINIASDIEGYKDFSLETLVEKNPRVYLTTEFNIMMSDITQRPGYTSIDAVVNNRIYALDDNKTSRSGPRIIDGLEELAKALYPELFK